MATYFGVARVRVLVILIAVAAVCAQPAAAQQRHDQYAGRRLSDALKILQTRGLRVVFSSEIVTSDMRVTVEPREATARKVLDELLHPHDLSAKEGPGHVIQVVRAKHPVKGVVRPPARTAAHAPPTLEPHRERVTVTAIGTGYEPAAVSSAHLRAREMQELAGVLADDPFRAVQTLPGAATGDDFRSEFSVRGSAYRHIGVVVDGVMTGWLRHTAYGRSDPGSVAMVSSYGVDQVTLQSGAYAQRHGSHLGAELDLTLREGSRERTRFRGAATTMHATLVGEGPIGRSQRGSWLATVRNSHRDWPIRTPRARSGPVLGFSDVQAKLVYDVSAAQQVSASVLTGRSSVDELDEQHMLGDGANRVTLATLGWRSTFGSRTAVSQRVSAVTHAFSNQTQAEQLAGRGSASAFAYRADVASAVAGGLLEAGTQLQHVGRRGDIRHEAVWLRSAYAHVTWMPTSRLKVAPGLRVADSTRARQSAVSPWILTEWSFHPNWTVRASTGRSHQFPGTEPVDRGSYHDQLEPEQATHVDVGIGHRVTSSVGWQATWFARRERDVLREPDTTAWLVSTPAAESSGVDRFNGRLMGTSQGVELRLERRSATGLSGWAAYSYGRTRYTDPSRHETFWGDFDQRHAINLSAVYRLSNRSALAATFRSGSNVPIPGYLVERDGGLFLGSHPNDVRLPRYARLDVRASRTFRAAGRRVTLFVDVVNVLNRTNIGPANGVIRPHTGEAIGFTEKLFSRLPTAGLAVEF